MFVRFLVPSVILYIKLRKHHEEEGAKVITA